MSALTTRALTAAGLLFCVTLGARPASAQSFGVKGGVNLSRVVFDGGDIRASQKPGGVAGGFIGIALFRRLGLQAEALFAQRRLRFEDVVHDEINYLEVPILARYRVFTAGSWRVSVVGGAVLGFRLDAREIISGQSIDVSEAYQPFDLSGSIGADVELGRRWLVDARYIHGMSNIYDVPGINAKYRSVQVTAGYRFR